MLQNVKNRRTSGKDSIVTGIFSDAGAESNKGLAQLLAEKKHTLTFHPINSNPTLLKQKGDTKDF